MTVRRRRTQARRRHRHRHPGRSLAHRAGRRRQQQPGLRQRHRDDARQACAARACATSRVLLVRIRRGPVAAGRELGQRRQRPAQLPGGEACLVYITSHGDESGFFLRPDRRHCQPASLDSALSDGCGTRPTVLIVSACHSGTFINAEMRQPNRIILAAAATDRTSFGCGANDRLHLLRPVPAAAVRRGIDLGRLAQATRACVETLERRLGVRQQSQPQRSSARRSPTSACLGGRLVTRHSSGAS